MSCITNWNINCDALEPRMLLAVVPYRWSGETDPTVTRMAGGQSDDWYDVALTGDEKAVIVGAHDTGTNVYRFNRDGIRRISRSRLTA